jgi:hypothetical protein
LIHLAAVCTAGGRTAGTGTETASRAIWLSTSAGTTICIFTADFSAITTFGRVAAIRPKHRPYRTTYTDSNGQRLGQVPEHGTARPRACDCFGYLIKPGLIHQRPLRKSIDVD